MAGLNGFLLIDKDPDWTSSDVVSKLRGILHEKRIGHAGTLDPMATGLLIVMIGKCTKASDVIMHRDKEYIAGIRFGIETDTQDITGTVLKETAADVPREQLEEAIQNYIGEIEQIPPMYSAVKIHGQKLYSIARKGGEVEREPRKIAVYSIDVLSGEKNEFLLDIRCSSGTYIRTLCHDIGRTVGCGACMSSLRRIRIGEASVEDAHRISEIRDEQFLISEVLNVQYEESTGLRIL